MPQNERTLQFWDTFYEQQAQQQQSSATTDLSAALAKEWILTPSPVLLDQLISHLPKNRDPLRILEIGCGTSTLARELWLRITTTTNDTTRRIQVVATDVSQVCIEQNKQRDAAHLVQDSQDAGLEYSVLNVAENHPELQNQFDVILDKGCMDTFLFRTKQRGSGQKPYGATVRTVLDNVQSWLRGCSSDDSSGGAGVYLVLTPRHKLKSARDYIGFSSVERHVLDLSDLKRGDLVGEVEEDDERIFLYKCWKNTSYSPTDAADAFRRDNTGTVDEDTCPGCGVTFVDFRKGEELWGKGKPFWYRQWKGHRTHCRG